MANYFLCVVDCVRTAIWNVLEKVRMIEANGQVEMEKQTT